jgi:hypothetical protein
MRSSRASLETCVRIPAFVSRFREAIPRVRVLLSEMRDSAKRTIAVGLRSWDDVKQAGIWLRLLDGRNRKWYRILPGLFLAIVLVAAGHWMWGVWRAWQLADAASVTRTWPTSSILSNVAVEVETRCSDSRLSYVVVLVPPKSSAARTVAERTDVARILTDKLRERLKVLTFQLIDKDGIPAATHALVIDEFVRIYSSNDERPTILEARGTLACDPATYVRAETLTLSWTERHDR